MFYFICCDGFVSGRGIKSLHGGVNLHFYDDTGLKRFQEWSIPNWILYLPVCSNLPNKIEATSNYSFIDNGCHLSAFFYDLSAYLLYGYHYFLQSVLCFRKTNKGKHLHHTLINPNLLFKFCRDRMAIVVSFPSLLDIWNDFAVYGAHNGVNNGPTI